MELLFFLDPHPLAHMFPGQRAGPAGDSPLTVRCTQLPLWKVSYCCSSIRSLHSYQPWSSERTGSICREAFPYRVALPADREDNKHQSLAPRTRLSDPSRQLGVKRYTSTFSSYGILHQMQPTSHGAIFSSGKQIQDNAFVCLLKRL